MSRLFVLFSLIVSSLSVVPFKNRSTEGNYQLKTKSLEVSRSLGVATNQKRESTVS